jgi:membrane-associated phospholipid phosphatase
MPSGDTIQSMFFTLVMIWWYGVNPLVMIVFHILVAVSRVYFMCHWLGDTVIATVLAYPIGLFFFWLRIYLRKSWEPVINSMIDL